MLEAVESAITALEHPPEAWCCRCRPEPEWHQQELDQPEAFLQEQAQQPEQQPAQTLQERCQ
ncbi:MAG TPA: hypothetical protein VFS24_08890, partial [Steroidobacteraceae bacterium]|nr:hypothetical protein [Steroidobacteraceae bacterium]